MRYFIGVLAFLLGIFIISSAQVGAAETVVNGHVFQMTMTKSDSMGRGDDYLNPAPINERINVTIRIDYFGDGNESNVVVAIQPYLNGYSTFKSSNEGDFPLYDPNQELNQSESMKNLYEIIPSGHVSINEVEPGKRTFLNYTLTLKTAGSWNFLIMVTLQNGTTYVLTGSTTYISRNLPIYLDDLLFAAPLIVGAGSVGLIMLYKNKHKFKNQ